MHECIAQELAAIGIIMGAHMATVLKKKIEPTFKYRKVKIVCGLVYIAAVWCLAS